MTSNQIAFQNLQESKRSNLARETETHRSNVTRERETWRSNKAREDETLRSNLMSESLRKKDLSQQLFRNLETERSNRAHEKLARDRLAHDQYMYRDMAVYDKAFKIASTAEKGTKAVKNTTDALKIFG